MLYNQVSLLYSFDFVCSVYINDSVICDGDSQNDALTELHAEESIYQVKDEVDPIEQCDEPEDENQVKIEDRPISLLIDANALQEAKSKLVQKAPLTHSEFREQEQMNDDKGSDHDGLQGVIFAAISKIRQYHTDSEDDQNESDSFCASD